MPTTAVATNHFAAVARQIKARRMADVLTLHHADAGATERMPERVRLVVAELAGCRPPSAATWAVVVEMVAGDVAFTAAQATCTRCGELAVGAGLCEGCLFDGL